MKVRSLVRVPAVEVFGAALLVWINESIEQTGCRALDSVPRSCRLPEPRGPVDPNAKVAHRPADSA